MEGNVMIVGQDKKTIAKQSQQIKELTLIDNIVNGSLQKIHDEKVSKDHVLHHLKQIKAQMGKELKKGYSEPHKQGISRCVDMIDKKITKINKQ